MSWYYRAKTAGVDRAIEQQLDAAKLRTQRNLGEVVRQMQSSPGVDPDKLEELVGEGVTVYFPVGPNAGLDGISWSYGILHKVGENEYALFNTDEGDFPVTGITPQSISKVEGFSIFAKALYENPPR